MKIAHTVRDVICSALSRALSEHDPDDRGFFKARDETADAFCARIRETLVSQERARTELQEALAFFANLETAE